MPIRARERPRTRAPLAALLAFALAPGAGACSFYKLRPAPPPSDWPDPVLPSSSQEKCTESPGPPVVDTVIGVGFGTIAYIERNAIKYEFVYNPDGSIMLDANKAPVVTPTSDTFSRGVALTLAITAIPYLASAIYGYIQSSRCRRYVRLFRQ